MKNINLEMYGCTKITANHYKLGRLEFSVIKSCDNKSTVIDCDMGGRLNWAEIRTLPHNNDLFVNFNNETVSNKDIINYINNCKEYEKAYITLENSIPTHTFEEYKKIIKFNTEIYKKDYEIITKNLNWDNFLILPYKMVIDILNSIIIIKTYGEYTDVDITIKASIAFNNQDRRTVKFENHSPLFEKLANLKLIINY